MHMLGSEDFACWAFLCGLISDRAHCLIYLKFIFINFDFFIERYLLKGNMLYKSIS